MSNEECPDPAPMLLRYKVYAVVIAVLVTLTLFLPCACRVVGFPNLVPATCNMPSLDISLRKDYHVRCRRLTMCE